MSSYDMHVMKSGPHRYLFCALLVAVSISLSACGFQPVYGPNASGVSVRSELKSVHIQPPRDRIEQEVRNEVLFAFGQNSETSLQSAAHVLAMRASASRVNAVVSRSGIATARILKLDVSYTLTDSATGEAVLTSKASAQSSYDIFDQQFANDRARIDAENRAARDVAAQINNQVAAYLSVDR